MHDPSTLAFEIKRPWRGKPSTLFPKGYRPSIIDIWHDDPNIRGDDDSCGWFIRPRHLPKGLIDRIVRAYDFDWDRTFKSDSGKVYYTGYFFPEDDESLVIGKGSPAMCVNSIVLNLFYLAALEIFKSDGKTNWKKARRYMQDHLFDILHFAENPTDSLRHSVVRFWGTDTKRNERMREIAGCIAAYIMRDIRPWYRHPRWHVHHWRIQVLFLQTLKRFLFSRCCKCGKRFSWGYAPVTDQWDGEGPRWFRGEPGVRHADCSNPTSNCCAANEPQPKSTP